MKLVKEGEEENVDESESLEDEMIALVHVKSATLCEFRKNKFPQKMRPIGIDYCIPDDEGRRIGFGVMEMMDGPQKAYDALFNQYIFGTMMSNNPPGFFSPLANQPDEAIKTRLGYLNATSDPQGVSFLQVPAPNASLERILEIIRYWAQLLFGISDYASGVESTIDPSAPAKKAEIVVAQGSVRLNMLIKRKVKTLQDIYLRWFLLYRDNMPTNKFVRIVGDSKDNPWQFQAVSMNDFALKALPDFELTGNILNVNKTLEAQKKMAYYQALSQNFLFSPQTASGLKAYYELTKWLMDGIDEIGLSRILPKPAHDDVHTAEEENALMLQGDKVEPSQQEDFIYHLTKHREMLLDPGVPEEVKREFLAPHIDDTIKAMQQMLMQQTIAQTHFGGNNGESVQPGAPADINPMVSGQPGAMGGVMPGGGAMPPQRGMFP